MNKINKQIVRLLTAFFATGAMASSAQAAATITVVNLDGAGEGFNDPAAPEPNSTAGGNISFSTQTKIMQRSCMERKSCPA